MKQSRWLLYSILVVICCLYWCQDAAWSYISYERNLNTLIYTVPSSFFDTFLLQVSPYQKVSRLSVLALLLFSGTLLIEFSHRKQKIASALTESEKRYQYLLEHANVGTCIEQNQRIKIPNLKILDITGYSEDELTQLTFSELIHPDDLEMILGWNEDLSAGKAPATDTPFQILTKEQKIKWLLLDVTSVIWQGKPARFCVLRDITERRNLEKKNQQAKKMEAIGLLAGGVAHDLNNILSGIVSYPELMLLQLPKESPLRSPLQTIHDSGIRASAIIADLLTVARGVASNRKNADLNEIVEYFLNTPEYHNLIDHHPGGKLSLCLHKDEVNIYCSDIHIQKSIMNLVFNAFEALELNSGLITLSTDCRDLTEPECQKFNLKAGRYAVLSVADTGSGITEEQKEHIFEPFYTKKKMGRSGTGLGLTVVWNTVVEHEGVIDIQSSKQGTTFSLYFPEVPIKKLPAISGQTNDPLLCEGAGTKILLIDDDPMQREIGTQFLTFLGYTPLPVASGEEAIAFLQDTQVDLIILDMIMEPGMNGRETYEKILAMHPDQKAIIVSGYSAHSEITKTMELGAGNLLKKPYTMEKLGVAVQAELS